MQVSEHQVRERAYYIWEEEGRVHGRADAHWFLAEAEFATAPKAKTARAPARKAAVAAKPSASKTAVKTAAAKIAAPKAAAPKVAAPKATKLPKAAVAAGIAAKAKPARVPTVMH